MKEPGVITPHPDCKVCREREEQERKILEKAKAHIAEYNKKVHANRKN